MPLLISTLKYRLLLLSAGAVVSLLAATEGHGQRPGETGTLTISREIKGGPPITLEFRGTFADGAGRLDVVGGSDAAKFPPGAYILVSDTSGAALIVMPGEKLYGAMGAGARLGGIVEMYTPAGTITDLSVKIDSLGPGEAIDGRPTGRYRITSQFNLTISNNGGVQGVAVSKGVTDLWQADIHSKIPNPFLGLGGDPAPSDPLKELNAALRSVQKRLPGVTVKSETTATLSARGVAFTNQRVTTSLSNIRDTTVDLAKLAIPAGYSRRSQ